MGMFKRRIVGLFHRVNETRPTLTIYNRWMFQVIHISSLAPYSRSLSVKQRALSPAYNVQNLLKCVTKFCCFFDTYVTLVMESISSSATIEKVPSQYMLKKKKFLKHYVSPFWLKHAFSTQVFSISFFFFFCKMLPVFQSQQQKQQVSS